MTTQPENHQDPQTNDTKKKDTKPLWYMLAIAAVCIFAFSLYVIFNSGTKHNADPPPPRHQPRNTTSAAIPTAT